MLIVHRASRADRLVTALADLLVAPPDDPFAPEVVAVHSRGIERWLAQELAGRLGAAAARHDGVCANIEFPFPGTLVRQALLAIDPTWDREHDPWEPARLAWPLLRVLEDRAARASPEWLPPLIRSQAGPDRRRFPTARRLADLFDRYSVHRPEMLQAWADDRDELADGAPLPPGARWQAPLWRDVRDAVGSPSPAERLPWAVEALAAGDGSLPLPDRVALFGLTALPSSYVQVLRAIAAHRDVHLFLLHPSPGLWEAVRPSVGLGTVTRDDDPTRARTTHPLLAAWGRDAREMQLVLGSLDISHDRSLDAPDDGGPARRLLDRIQDDLIADRAPGTDASGAPAPHTLDRGDRSVQVHACHGRVRQVQVLRDAILHMLAADPSLEPRDVVVMCPDIETYAPLIEAVFGAHAVADDADGPAAHALPPLRVRLADRSLRRTNPVLQVVDEVLGLIDGRLPASRVLDLAARAPVRRHFALTDEDLSTLEIWIEDLRVRWGLDAQHRRDLELATAANTWDHGLQRLLTGVAVADEALRTVAGVVPYDHTEGAAVDLAGRLAELLARLGSLRTELADPKPLAAWGHAIRRLADLLTAAPEADAWQRAQLDRILDDVVAQAGQDSPDDLTLAEVRTLLADRLAGKPTRANHRTGDLTVCTLVPMRSVPHRVVCLLGMDDEAFPRATVADGDDLVDQHPRIGDRDPRAEDRQLLLDALLSAGDALIVTYTGADERTNEPRPPAVPIGELLDTIDATAITGDGAAVRSRVVLQHPLQAADPRNFREDDIAAGWGPFGFDPVALAGARAAQDVQPPRRLLAAPLDPIDGPVTVHDLTGLLVHPARTFCQTRLGIWLSQRPEHTSDAIPVELGPLDSWAVGERLLATRRQGLDRQRWLQLERGRGVVPPGALGDHSVAELDDRVAAVLAATEPALAAPDRTQVEIELDVDGQRVVGAVAAVPEAGLLGEPTTARLKPKRVLRQWIELVVLSAAHPEVEWQAQLTGRAQRGQRFARVTLGPIQPAHALELLHDLLELHRRGLCAPLPLYCETSADVAEKAFDGLPIRTAARSWESGFFPGEDADPYHVAVVGPQVPFTDLLQSPPEPDEVGGGWPVAETRLEVYARRLWAPIREHRTEAYL